MPKPLKPLGERDKTNGALGGFSPGAWMASQGGSGLATTFMWLLQQEHIPWWVGNAIGLIVVAEVPRSKKQCQILVAILKKMDSLEGATEWHPLDLLGISGTPQQKRNRSKSLSRSLRELEKHGYLKVDRSAGAKPRTLQVQLTRKGVSVAIDLLSMPTK